jgi:hypothetical protein
MAEDRVKISTGPNERAVNEPIAGTAPGLPDEALAPGKELPERPERRGGEADCRTSRRSHPEGRDGVKKPRPFPAGAQPSDTC